MPCDANLGGLVGQSVSRRIRRGIPKTDFQFVDEVEKDGKPFEYKWMPLVVGRSKHSHCNTLGESESSFQATLEVATAIIADNAFPIPSLVPCTLSLFLEAAIQSN